MMKTRIPLGPKPVSTPNRQTSVFDLLAQSKAHLANRRTNEALAALSLAQRLDPNNRLVNAEVDRVFELFMGRARRQLRTHKDIQGARLAVKRALEVKPHDPGAIELSQKISPEVVVPVHSSPPPPISAAAPSRPAKEESPAMRKTRKAGLLSAAEKYMLEGNISMAVNCALSAMKLTPHGKELNDFYDSLDAVSEVRLRLGLISAKSDVDNHVRIMPRLLISLIEQGEMDEARQIGSLLRQSEIDTSQISSPLFDSGFDLFCEGTYAGAANSFTIAHELNPAEVEIYCMMVASNLFDRYPLLASTKDSRQLPSNLQGLRRFASRLSQMVRVIRHVREHPGIKAAELKASSSVIGEFLFENKVFSGLKQAKAVAGMTDLNLCRKIIAKLETELLLCLAEADLPPVTDNAKQYCLMLIEELQARYPYKPRENDIVLPEDRRSIERVIHRAKQVMAVIRFFEENEAAGKNEVFAAGKIKNLVYGPRGHIVVNGIVEGHALAAADKLVSAKVIADLRRRAGQLEDVNIIEPSPIEEDVLADAEPVAEPRDELAAKRSRVIKHLLDNPRLTFYDLEQKHPEILALINDPEVFGNMRVARVAAKVEKRKIIKAAEEKITEGVWAGFTPQQKEVLKFFIFDNPNISVLDLKRNHRKIYNMIFHRHLFTGIGQVRALAAEMKAKVSPCRS
ncbi:MAG: hypothetical protein ABIE84_03485 [bacterium]